MRDTGVLTRSSDGDISQCRSSIALFGQPHAATKQTQLQLAVPCPPHRGTSLSSHPHHANPAHRTPSNGKNTAVTSPGGKNKGKGKGKGKDAVASPDVSMQEDDEDDEDEEEEDYEMEEVCDATPSLVPAHSDARFRTMTTTTMKWIPKSTLLRSSLAVGARGVSKSTTLLRKHSKRLV